MSPPLKDVLLVGYGAVGAIYSLILKRSGRARVTTIARSNYEAVTTQGMTFHSEKYGHIEGWKPDRVFSSVAEACDRPYAYVLLTTKAIPEVIRTATLLSPLLSPSYVKAYPQPTYVLMQNGLNVEKDLYKAIESLGQVPKIISTAVWIGTNMIDTNVVEHNAFDRVSMGTYRFNDFTTTTNTESEQALLSDFADVLSTGGSTVSVVPEIQRVKYAKNMWNAVFASVASLTRHPLTAVFRLPTTSQPSDVPKSVSQAPLITQNTVIVIRAAMQELLKVGHALGFPDDQSGLPSSVVEATIESTRKLHSVPESKHRPSMLVDIEKGRPIEVEVVLGEVVRMARERGIDIPRIEMLYAMLLVVQNQLLQNSEKRI